jgi:hypothetical protein
MNARRSTLARRVDNQRKVALDELPGGGIVTRSGDVYALRTLQAGAGVTIANPDGVDGDPTISASGGSGDYTHNQAVPATTWTITHGLGRYPSVTVVDSAGSVVEGDVQYVSSNQITCTFASAFSGKAYLS